MLMMRLFVFTILIFMSSCAPVYVPNLRNSPLFTEAGEFQGTFQMDGGIDAQAAVSVTDHIGLMTNFSYVNRNKNDGDNEDEYHRHKFLEGGIGYYQNSGKWCFEVFAGYGKGEGSSYDEYYFFDDNSVRATGKYNRFFIQPAIGLNKKGMNVSFVPRIAVVDFYSFKDDQTGTVIQHVGDPDVFFEPAVIGRANLMNNRFYFTFQGGLSFPVATNVYYDYTPFKLGVGFGFRLGGLKPESKVE